MLHLSDNIIQDDSDLQGLRAPALNSLPPFHLQFRRVLWGLLLIFFLFMLLPWTQNVRTSGKVTTLSPEHRPQTIHATISGRIEKWYVAEGQQVRRGDTIVFLSEVKSDYFDPKLIDRTADQLLAKQRSVAAYSEKAGALANQVLAYQRELEQKIDQTRAQIKQAALKIESDSIKVVQAGIDLQVAQRQLDGAKNLYERGLKSLTEMEEKRLKWQEAQTKQVAARNQLESSRNDLNIYRAALPFYQNEYAGKIAKVQSERFATLSDGFEATGAVNKLEIDRDNYRRRAAFYYILAPQDGYIVRALAPGIGEIIKEGGPVVSIQPLDYELAVEMYVRPVDLPLIQKGSAVRFVFDGWPAFVFSGWPGATLGTFGGWVVAIDRNISDNGKFRVLVGAEPGDSWPAALQMGGGARGIALLNTVPLWYEMWRVLNGFPPDLYEDVEAAVMEKDKKSDYLPSENKSVGKAPIRNVK